MKKLVVGAGILYVGLKVKDLYLWRKYYLEDSDSRKTKQYSAKTRAMRVKLWTVSAKLNTFVENLVTNIDVTTERYEPTHG